jgi:heme-degrading monooxygenase HmoA
MCVSEQVDWSRLLAPHHRNEAPAAKLDQQLRECRMARRLSVPCRVLTLQVEEAGTLAYAAHRPVAQRRHASRAQSKNGETQGDSMISLFFEVQIKDGHTDRYLDLAASLKPRLVAMGGCLFIDRFRSLTRPNLLLSYQIWQDEGAMTAWRVEPHHHRVQEVGREKVFSDYRLRIAQVMHEATPGKPAWQPDRRTPYNDPARRPPTYVIATESRNARLPVQTHWRSDAFESVYRPGQFAHLVDVPDYQSGLDFAAGLFADPSTEYVRVVEVMRDYGMFDRAEAPQYYPAIDRGTATGT